MLWRRSEWLHHEAVLATQAQGGTTGHQQRQAGTLLHQFMHELSRRQQVLEVVEDE